jgi:WD40 repeat protein
MLRNNKASLMLYSLDGRQQYEIASLGVGLFSDPTSFTAVWSPDGERILINQPAASLSNTTWKTYNLHGGNGTPVFLGEVDPNHYLRPLDWSPDGKWFAMAESPFPYARLYVKEISASDRLRLLLDNPDNRAAWLGWSTSN